MGIHRDPPEMGHSLICCGVYLFMIYTSIDAAQCIFYIGPIGLLKDIARNGIYFTIYTHHQQICL